jgi:hypothetical protein
MDLKGYFALKIAVQNKDFDRIEEVIDMGGDINKVDLEGRNSLHIAVNGADVTADASFELE